MSAPSSVRVNSQSTHPGTQETAMEHRNWQPRLAQPARSERLNTTTSGGLRPMSAPQPPPRGRVEQVAVSLLYQSPSSDAAGQNRPLDFSGRQELKDSVVCQGRGTLASVCHCFALYTAQQPQTVPKSGRVLRMAILVDWPRRAAKNGQRRRDKREGRLTPSP
jgi:hypothetical protein